MKLTQEREEVKCRINKGGGGGTTSVPSLELRPQILIPESALKAASSPKLAPSRVQRTSGKLPAPGARPQPHSPGSPAAGAAGAASANSGAGCCGCCSPWSSSELMCWGFACLRLDMVRASGRLESRGYLPTPPQIPGVRKFTPLRPERACPSNYYYQ